MTAEADLVERVAKALYERDPLRWPSDPGEPEGDVMHWDDLADPSVQKNEYRAMARVAIGAIPVTGVGQQNGVP
jgi:hypothetical protein